jgi:hypothetical protein
MPAASAPALERDGVAQLADAYESMLQAIATKRAQTAV